MPGCRAFRRICRGRHFLCHLRLPDNRTDGARSRCRRPLPAHVLFPAHQAHRTCAAMHLRCMRLVGGRAHAPGRHGRVWTQPGKLCLVCFQPFLLSARRLFRRRIRPEAPASHVVAFDRGAVLSGLAAALPDDRWLAVSLAALFRVDRRSDLICRVRCHGRIQQGSRILSCAVPCLGTPAGRRSGIGAPSAVPLANGRILRRSGPDHDHRFRRAAGRDQYLPRSSGAAAVPRCSAADLCGHERATGGQPAAVDPSSRRCGAHLLSALPLALAHPVLRTLPLRPAAGLDRVGLATAAEVLRWPS